MGVSPVFTLFALIVLCSLARAQQFTNVLIKPSASGDPGSSRMQIFPSGRLVGHSITVGDLIDLAYRVPSNPSPRLALLPEWANLERFDIEAETSASLNLDREDIQAQRQTIELLLRKLLSDRFGLVLKVKTVATPVYALTVSGKDRKLPRSAISPRDCILDTAPSGCHSFVIGFGHPLNSKAVDMSDLAEYLENWTDLPVVNRTSTTGMFEMQSKGWQPMSLPPPPPGASGTGVEFANLSTLSEVLSSFGLKLHRVQDSVSFHTVQRLVHPNAR